MLILRFTDKDDRVTIHPVGAEFHSKHPEMGMYPMESMNQKICSMTINGIRVAG